MTNELAVVQRIATELGFPQRSSPEEVTATVARRLAQKDAFWGLVRSRAGFLPGRIAYNLGMEADEIRILDGTAIVWEEVGAKGRTWMAVSPLDQAHTIPDSASLDDVVERLDRMIGLLERIGSHTRWTG